MQCEKEEPVMIERYRTAGMNVIWSDENRFRKWLDVEIAVCQAWLEAGIIPQNAFDDIIEKASFDVQRIAEIEETTQHDVIAFVSCVAEHVGPSGRYIHLGLTSSDVVDTAASLLLKEALSLILDEVEAVKNTVLSQAWKYKTTLCVGRTHGVHAEPTTFGLKLLNWYEELERNSSRLLLAKEQISTGKISGAVGTYAHCPPSIEARTCQLLKLDPAPISTQILQRDRHAFVLTTLSVLGGSIERMATEFRHLQRTEVLEAGEPFRKGQKGSSAMPHKRNPIISERLCGMARLLRGYAVTAMENMALWHERDISHSSTERVIWPDAFHLAHYMLLALKRLVSEMTVDKDRMASNMNLTRGLLYSQRVLLHLIEEGGMTREDAYHHVQSAAMRCWNGEGDFSDLLTAIPQVASVLPEEKLPQLFTPDHYLRHVDTIFNRFPPSPDQG
jgi:adenylosuccinate lyase